jgi:hypothetical protein
MIYSILHENGSSHKSNKASAMLSKRNQRERSAGGPGSAKHIMPPISSFALSQDESKMNLYLKSSDIICFDESRTQIIDQLDDFGLA